MSSLHATLVHCVEPLLGVYTRPDVLLELDTTARILDINEVTLSIAMHSTMYARRSRWREQGEITDYEGELVEDVDEGEDEYSEEGKICVIISRAGCEERVEERRRGPEGGERNGKRESSTSILFPFAIQILEYSRRIQCRYHTQSSTLSSTSNAKPHTHTPYELEIPGVTPTVREAFHGGDDGNDTPDTCTHLDTSS